MATRGQRFWAIFSNESVQNGGVRPHFVYQTALPLQTRDFSNAQQILSHENTIQVLPRGIPGILIIILLQGRSFDRAITSYLCLKGKFSSGTEV